MTTIPESRVAERTGFEGLPLPFEATGRRPVQRGVRCRRRSRRLRGGCWWGSRDQLVPPPIALALVIGNGDYVHTHDLRTPRNEAAAMAAALERLGFRVRHLEDAGYLDMLQGLLEFSQ